MENSSVYQMIIERGFERGIETGKKLGMKELAIERILHSLNRRFNTPIAADVLTPSLEKIDDRQHLNQLMDAAAEAEHLEDFMQTLSALQNGINNP